MELFFPRDDSAPQGDSAKTATSPFSVAKSLAPEDVRVGDYVAVLHEVCEAPSFWWPCDSTLGQRDEVVRLVFTPRDSGEPLKVCAVCLPFVLVKPAKGKVRALDVRRFQLARLNADYAATWKAEKRNKSKAKAKA